MSSFSQLNALLRSRGNWSTLLLIEICFIIFLVSFVPISWQESSVRILYSLLYITAAFGLDRHRSLMLQLGGLTLLIMWISKTLELPLLHVSTQVLNIIFFTIIVGLLINQIARAREVSARVMLDAINGYLMVGLTFAFMVALMIHFDKMAFNFSSAHENNTIDTLYYSFVTFATLGYGDMVPLKPHAKSLSILIVIGGQLYIAVIIALLLGKFSNSSK